MKKKKTHCKKWDLPQRRSRFISATRLQRRRTLCKSYIHPAWRQVQGRMHGKHRHADVYHVDVAVRHILGHTVSPAAEIHLAKLAGLPQHIPRSRMSVTQAIISARKRHWCRDLPRKPVYFVTTTPRFRCCEAFRFCVRSEGRDAAFTSADRHFAFWSIGFIVCACVRPPDNQEWNLKSLTGRWGHRSPLLPCLARMHTRLIGSFTPAPPAAR